jgi:hypothetical protein
MSYKFHEGQHVTVTRLGENTPGEFEAIIHGIAGNLGPYGYMWIVEWVQKPKFIGPLEWMDIELQNLNFSCAVIPEGCIDFKISL